MSEHPKCPGNHAVDRTAPQRRIRWASLGLCLVLSLMGRRAAAQPANNDFAAATVIAMLPFTDSEDTTSATNEVGEPMPCVGIGRTVWYQFTPATDGLFTADTSGSNFDTALAVYTGTNFSDLVDIDCNDDYFGLQSRVAFSASSGVTYYFQAGGYIGGGGSLTFHLNPPSCGDGVVDQPSEQCDGSDVSACPSFQCQSDCTCVPPTCGDGVVDQTSEQCDGLDASACPSHQCQSDCTCVPPACGDGIVDQTSEQCDGPDVSACPSHQCQSDCTCVAPTCGDGVVDQTSEECDGSDVSACPSFQCQSDCTCVPPTCGDGIVDQPSEQCDGSDAFACLSHECQADCTCVPPPPPLFPQCPPIGLDSGCSVLLTVNPGGCSLVVASDPNQPPYDGADDTLTGIQNNSGSPLCSVALTGTTDIFGFDGDGLCSAFPAPAGCPFGPTGYEGPGVSFSVSTISSGTVNFSPCIPPGGSAYFSLEEALTTVGACNANGTCDAACGETCANCPNDCGLCSCGNGTCDPGESAANCPADCQLPCGNGTCDAGDTCTNCAADCGLCFCGNGTCDPSEDCASCATDCGQCAPTPTGTPTGTAAATATATPTGTPTGTAEATVTPTDTEHPTPTPTLPPVCQAAPATGCSTPQGPERIFRLSSARKKLSWKWRSTANVPLADFGDPLHTTSYAFCVYANGNLVMAARIPADGTCDGKPCWRSKGSSGFRYLDTAKTPDGIARLRLRPKPTEIRLGGQGPNIPGISAAGLLPFAQPVLAQLVRSDGPKCWEARYSAPAQKNSSQRFVDKNDP